MTLDIAHSMKHIAQKCFPKAIQVTDRFHVQKLAIEALQDLRIKHRWEATGFENEQILATTVSLNYRSFLNYFRNRSSNASAESFNAKIKAFRS